MNFLLKMEYKEDKINIFMNCSQPFNVTYQDDTGFITKNIEGLHVSEELKHVLQQYRANGNLEDLFLRSIGKTRRINDHWSICFDHLYYQKEIFLAGLEKEASYFYNNYLTSEFPSRNIISKEDILKEYKKIKEDSE